jgi:predicted transcriptional regulator
MAVQEDVDLLSPQGRVLFIIAVRPGCTIKDLAGNLSVTRRTVWSIIGDLRRAGMLRVENEGRRHHYFVNLDGPFKHPVLGGLTLRPILRELIAQSERAR